MLQNKIGFGFSTLQLHSPCARSYLLLQHFELSLLFTFYDCHLFFNLLSSQLLPSLLFFLLEFLQFFLDKVGLDITSQINRYFCCLARFYQIFLRFKHSEDSFPFMGIYAYSIVFAYSQSCFCFILNYEIVFLLCPAYYWVFASHYLWKVVRSSLRQCLTYLFSLFCLFLTSVMRLESIYFLICSALIRQFSARIYLPSFANCSICSSVWWSFYARAQIYGEKIKDYDCANTLIQNRRIVII